MTSQKIKFYKFNNHTTSAESIAKAKLVEGAVIYIVDLKELWIGSATTNEAKLVLRGTNDVTYNSTTSVLTVTSWDNAGGTTTQTLDFSDVASSSATLKVFEKVYNLMGATTSGTSKVLDYTNTHYLAAQSNLVGADKALDSAIYINTHKGAASDAAYDLEHLSSSWTTAVQGNIIAANDSLDTDVTKLDRKIAKLADEVIANEQVTQQAFTTVANSVGLESDMSLDLSSDTTKIIAAQGNVKGALLELATSVQGITDGAVKGVQINGSSIVENQIANIAVQGTYNSSTNKIATEETVTSAINALDVDTDKGAAAISGSTITIKGVQQENGLIKDGGTTTINLEGTYNETTNKIATQSTISNAIDAMAGAGLAVDAAGVITAKTQSTTDNTTNVATTEFVKSVVGTLDTSSDVQAVDYTAADASNGAKLTFKGVSETDGKIAQGSGGIVLQFAKVATTGTAADVAVVDSHSKYTASNLEDVLYEIAQSLDALVGGMRYNGNIDSTTATLNTSTHDIRPGDIYLASGAFTLDGTSVEAGDMIVYKGQKSQKIVTLDSSNCTIIEKETDTMVTAGDTLTDNYLVFGNGSKEVSITSTVDTANYQVTASDLKTAIENANSALQSIRRGTDGTYVTTTVGEKTNNSQSVGVALTYGTVTYSAKDGDTPAKLTVTSGNEGVLNTNAITPIKNYVDEKVSNVVSDLDVDEYAQASVTAANGGTTITVKGIKEVDGEIAASTSSADTTILADGEYSASTNKLATQSTVTNAINGLDTTEYQQASVEVDSTANTSALKIKGIKEVDGKIAAATGTPTTDVTIDGEYNASTNKLATQTTVSTAVSNAIDALDGSATIATLSSNVVTIKAGVTETNGVISNNSGSDIVLEEVAVTGAAADVSYNNTSSAMTATTVQAAIDELKSDLCWSEYD